MRWFDRATCPLAVVILLALAASPVTAKSLGPWSTPVSLESLPGSSSDCHHRHTRLPHRNSAARTCFEQLTVWLTRSKCQCRERA